MHAQVIADRLIEHELLLGTDFLNSAQVKINAGEIIIEASEDEEICEVCQLDVVPDEINNMDGTHVLNTEYQDATESLVDERKSEKASCVLEVLAMKEAQRDETDIERIFDLREKRGIDVGIERGVMPSREVDNDMRIVVPVSLKPRVIRQKDKSIVQLQEQGRYGMKSAKIRVLEMKFETKVGACPVESGGKKRRCLLAKTI